MCKNRNQRKNESEEQMNLFDGGEPVPERTGGTGDKKVTGAVLLSRLKENYTLSQNILEEILELSNLSLAFQQVVRNKGKGGTDDMDIEGLKRWYPKGIMRLREEILNEDYKVSPVRKVEIPKPSGGKRTLGIPTLKDRLIQQAIHQKLSLYYEPLFSERSYGFRRGRSAHQAVEQAAEYISEGKEWVVDIDLENFFDRINHDRLMTRLSKGIGDKKLLRLINQYLKAGMMEGGLTQQRIAGAPQGGPLSPLLSNIVLDELDKELEKRGLSFCRYADDCNIYVGSKKAGERVMISIIGFIEKKLKLKVNRQKSGVRRCSKVKFLGYTILEGGDKRISDKSLDRLKGKLKEITRRNRGVSFEAVVKELNRVIIGWTNYYRLANKWLSSLQDLDRLLRRRLRSYKLKLCKKRYAIYRFLRKLGVIKDKAWNAIMFSQGWWQMSDKPAVKSAMGLNWFKEQGLESIYSRIRG